jgi:hypothetical protein
MLQIIFHFNFDFDPIIRSKYFYNIQCNEPSLGGFEPNGKPNSKSLFWECKKVQSCDQSNPSPQKQS